MTTAIEAKPESLAIERERITRLVRGYSMEVSSRDLQSIDDCGAVLPRGASVYISMRPGQTYHGTVAFAARLAHAGFNPVPHIAARNLASVEAADDYVARAVGEAGVREMLVIGGDRALAAGPFDSSARLIETGLFARHGIQRLGVAGYPEAHPRLASAALDSALRAKRELARRNGLALYLVTQFGFDAAPIEAWLRRIAALNITSPLLPIRIGLAGPAGVTTLIKFAARCGIGASVRALGSHSASLARMLTEAGPEPVIRKLAEIAAQPAGAAIEGCHFFAFGGAVRTARWASSVADGQFEIPPHGEGFTVGAKANSKTPTVV